jgi:putative lipoic acid-binding regulatory protein
MSNSKQAQGMTFPCDFQVKAMGLAEPGFDALVVEIVRRHCADVREGAVSSKPSKNGKYVSITVGFQAESMEQLHAIYDALTAHDKVLMRL